MNSDPNANRHAFGSIIVITDHISLTLPPGPFLQSFNLALQLRQMLRSGFDGLRQGAMRFLQRLHPLLQRCHLLRNVTGVIVLLLTAVNVRIPVLLQRPSRPPGDVTRLIAGHHRAVVHLQGLCRGDLVPVARPKRPAGPIGG